MLNRKDILELYESGAEAIVILILTLQETNQRLSQQNQELIKRIEKLEEQVSKNSQNSHKPPSSDNNKKRTRPKKKDKRKVGGQRGHKGSTLQLSDNPDKTIVICPKKCQECGQDLSAVKGEVQQRKQVIEIPNPKVVTTEYQAIEKECPCCGVINKQPLPKQLKGRVQYGSRLRALVVYLMSYQLLPYERTTELLNTLYGVSISTGTLYRVLSDGYNQLESAEKAIKVAITNSEVVHYDETGHRVGKKTDWLHVASTKEMTYYYSHRSRGKKAHQMSDILPQFKGVAVHDFYHSYLSYKCDHALCNAHLLRDLQAVIERDSSQRWAVSLQRWLIKAHRMVKIAQANKKMTFSSATLSRLMAIYNRLITKAHQLNPKPPPSGKRGRTKQTTTRNLINRLQNHKQDIVRFIFDFKVPFDNNMAERDLRMVKVQQKISGCFRSELGAKIYCRLRGYISTLQKQHYDLFPILTYAMQGQVLIPIPTK